MAMQQDRELQSFYAWKMQIFTTVLLSCEIVQKITWYLDDKGSQAKLVIFRKNEQNYCSILNKYYCQWKIFYS